MITTEHIIDAALRSAVARPRERFVHAGGRGMNVRSPGEARLVLPNGTVLKMTSDEQGGTTQFEEGDALHAVARLRPIYIPLRRRS